MRKKCKNCEHNCEGDYCFRCKPRSPLPKISKKKKIEEEVVKAITDINPMINFFMEIWYNTPGKSEISGEYLGQTPSSAFFHHILPKEKYPEAKYDKENIILLTLDEHSNVESDMYKYEEINKRRELLKIKYNL